MIRCDLTGNRIGRTTPLGSDQDGGCSVQTVYKSMVVLRRQGHPLSERAKERECPAPCDRSRTGRGAGQLDRDGSGEVDVDELLGDGRWSPCRVWGEGCLQRCFDERPSENPRSVDRSGNGSYLDSRPRLRTSCSARSHGLFGVCKDG